MPSQPTLHFICGKLASGKTTLAKRIAEKESAILICEDWWLATLTGGIQTFDEYLQQSRRWRAALTPHVTELLRHGISVVFDFAGNTAGERKWVRSVFEPANAAHELHYIVASDAVCKVRLRNRNTTKPEGLYWATTTEKEFDDIVKYFVPPSEEEDFHVVMHSENDSSMRK